jgi:hypothetical protein
MSKRDEAGVGLSVFLAPFAIVLGIMVMAVCALGAGLHAVFRRPRVEPAQTARGRLAWPI